MRIIEEIQYPSFKLSLFYMNQKYILKFEQEYLEQSYKVSELYHEIADLNDVKAKLTDEFLERIETIFQSMRKTHLIFTV